MRISKIPLLVLVVAVLAGTTAFTAKQRSPSWERFDIGTDSRLRGLSAVSADVVWAGGSDGTVWRTVDGGASWQQVTPAGSAGLQFRDVEAFDAEHAVVMTAGSGDDSRVYVTDDGGSSWTETFRSDEPAAFYDCMAFFDRSHGLALSDPVNGFFRIISTSDGGHSWQVLPTAGMPPALDGEFAFAASGTCLVTADRGADVAWFASGGGAETRVFRSTDHGLDWEVVATPMPSGPAAGIFSLAFRDPVHGIAVGGDFLNPLSAPDGALTSGDSGRSWQPAIAQPGEYRSGSAWVPHSGRIALAVGPTGSDVSYDRGRTWTRFDSSSLDSVDCAPDGSCWGSGELGQVAKLHWG
jgi:photosystem II stability/assembly factor-like uncharacterized protein